MRNRGNALPQQVILLGWVSFFADISSEMIYPIIPLFLVGVLGSSSSASGFIEGMTQAIVSVMALLSGIFSDHIQRRVPFVRWGYGLPILGKFIISISTSWHFLLIGRLADRFGKGLRGSPRDALLAESIEYSRRGEAFGFHRMMDTAGALVGVLIAAGCLWQWQNKGAEFVYRLIFIIAAILALCSLIVSFFVSETSAATKRNATENPNIRDNQNLLQSVRTLGKEYWITLSILNIFAFANSSDAFLLLKAHDVGLSGLKVVLAYALYNASYSLLSSPAGKLSDRFGRWKIIGTGWAIYSAVYAGIAITNTSSIWLLFIGYGVYMSLTEGISKALVIDTAPPNCRGTALGILYLCLGLTALTSNLVAGFLWDNFGTSSPFWLGAMTSAVAAFVALNFRNLSLVN